MGAEDFQWLRDLQVCSAAVRPSQEMLTMAKEEKNQV
jgi:hypothetical protein